MSDREMSAEEIFKKLQDSKPLKLDELPKDKRGIYALFDHANILRYIGMTAAKRGFYERIYIRHTTGSEGMSHSFSTQYCFGPMWSHDAMLKPSLEEDAELAKKFSQAGEAENSSDAEIAVKYKHCFIRKNCRATYVPIPLDAAEVIKSYRKRLLSIETEVQNLADSVGIAIYSKKPRKSVKYESCPPDLRTLDEDILKALSSLKRFSKFTVSDLSLALGRQDYLYEEYIK